MSFSSYNFFPQVSPVRLVALANVTGNYDNGDANSGVNARILNLANNLQFDATAPADGDRVLLANQTAAAQNGIYVYLVDQDTKLPRLQRAEDMQSIEHFFGGLAVTVADGATKKGAQYVLVAPIPLAVGVDAVTFVQS